jgi:uncharacterized RmlC-like cupin family protein
MPASEPARLVPADARVASDATPGMVREEAIAEPGLWAGLVRTAGHTTSGWHHHGDHDSSIYVVGGTLRMESGPGGADVVDAAAGDFLFVPRGAIHREANPGDAESQLVVVRAGTGPLVVNVDGPAPLGSGGAAS